MTILPSDIIRDIRQLRDRIKALELGNPQLNQTIPYEDLVDRNASGYHESTSSSLVYFNVGRVSFSAQHLHYDFEKNDSLLTGGATSEFGITLSVPGLLVYAAQTPSSGSVYTGSIDLYEEVGEVHKGKILGVFLSGRRFGGGGSLQAKYLNTTLLRAQSHSFYNG